MSTKTPGLKEVCVPVLVVEIKVRGRVVEVIRRGSLSWFNGPVFSLCDSEGATALKSVCHESVHARKKQHPLLIDTLIDDAYITQFKLFLFNTVEV